MTFDPPLQSGTLLKRYKRFLADIQLDGGELITAHCPNTGAMTGCAEPGMRVWVQPSDDPKRKLKWTWELVDTGRGLACIHASRASKLVGEAIASGVLPALGSAEGMKYEPRYPDGEGRADLWLPGGGRPTFIEVKSVTLLLDAGRGAFPDAVSERATRHLHSLMRLRREGLGAAMVLAALHTGIERVGAAAHIDPRYAEALAEACQAGVEVLGLGMVVDGGAFTLNRHLPVY